MPTLLSCQGEKLPLNSTDRKSEQGAKKGTAPCEKRQHIYLLLIQLGEGRLPVRVVKGEVHPSRCSIRRRSANEADFGSCIAVAVQRTCN
jgi:hypothetical protein